MRRVAPLGHTGRMSEDGHSHAPGHGELDGTELRVRALQALLTEKGYIDPAALDAIADTCARGRQGEPMAAEENTARVNSMVVDAWEPCLVAD